MSPREYRRYPDGARSGEMRPSASRNRIFEIEMSGNSSWSAFRTWPMLCSGDAITPTHADSGRRRAGTCRSAPRRRHEHDGSVRERAVHVRAVEAALVGDRQLTLAALEGAVLPGDRDVVEEDVGLRGATCDNGVRVEQVARAAVLSSDGDQQGRTLWQRLDRSYLLLGEVFQHLRGRHLHHASGVAGVLAQPLSAVRAEVAVTCDGAATLGA